MPEMRQRDPRRQWQPAIVQARPPRRPQRPRRRFRTSILWVIAAVLLGAWVVSSVRPAGSADDLLAALAIRGTARFKGLLILGTVICSILLVARILGAGRRRGE